MHETIRRIILASSVGTHTKDFMQLTAQWMFYMAGHAMDYALVDKTRGRKRTSGVASTNSMASGNWRASTQRSKGRSGPAIRATFSRKSAPCEVSSGIVCNTRRIPLTSGRSARLKIQKGSHVVVDSVNGTVWGPLSEYLVRDACMADAVPR